MTNPINRVGDVKTDDQRLNRFSEQVSAFSKTMPIVLETGKEEVANGATATLHTAAVNENELYSGQVSFAASETTADNMEMYIPSGGSGRIGYFITNDGSGNMSLRVKNETGAAITVVWVAFKWHLPQVTS